jgi:peptidoglycan/LPS O-acetylase OafA/YrhL
MKKRNFGLDLVRSIAIILVLVGHGRRIDPQIGFIGDSFLGVEIFFG